MSAQIVPQSISPGIEGEPAPELPQGESAALPVAFKVNDVTIMDLVDALKKGVADFLAMPSHAIFLCLIYPVIGLLLGRAAFGYDVLPLLFPIIAGFALLGPLAALGLYELSRRRERGEDASWRHALDVLRSPSIGAIVILGLALVAIFTAWLITAQAIYVANFGEAAPASIAQFAADIAGTSAGWKMMLLGNAAGFLFALLVFAISVVSFPLLLEHKVGVATAVVTSLRAVAKNPVTMAVWGLIVAAGLLIGSLPLFIGLAIVMPIFGHATWHLYRKTISV